MATWTDLCSYIRKQYNVAEENDSFLRLEFAFDTGRTQTVFVQRLDAHDNTEWASIESVIGLLDELNVHHVLESASGLVCGGLGRAGDLLTLRDSFPLATLDVNEFEGPLKLVSNSADSLERQHVGADIA